jgi:hypothetical protein
MYQRRNSLERIEEKVRMQLARQCNKSVFGDLRT